MRTTIRLLKRASPTAATRARSVAMSPMILSKSAGVETVPPSGNSSGRRFIGELRTPPSRQKIVASPGDGITRRPACTLSHFLLREWASNIAKRQIVALTSTVYHLEIDLSDVDRGVYEKLDLRLARHPSESTHYLLTRA